MQKWSLIYLFFLYLFTFKYNKRIIHNFPHLLSWSDHSFKSKEYVDLTPILVLGWNVEGQLIQWCIYKKPKCKYTKAKRSNKAGEHFRPHTKTTDNSVARTNKTTLTTRTEWQGKECSYTANRVVGGADESSFSRKLPMIGHWFPRSRLQAAFHHCWGCKTLGRMHHLCSSWEPLELQIRCACKQIGPCWEAKSSPSAHSPGCASCSSSPLCYFSRLFPRSAA